ncbi:MAG: CBS domain-containing protein [Deltaproteobacteria bacterium]|nr:CBS domain-containing protein [Deltaproteobacteria bacterium]
MSKSTPQISRFMTPLPISIGPRQPLVDAHKLMSEHHIRHLPVLDDGKLVGVVSMHDLHLLETLKDVDPRTVTIEDAMTREVFAAQADERIDEVAEVMAERKIGSAVVMDAGAVVGMFTTVDALRALVDLARSRAHK